MLYFLRVRLPLFPRLFLFCCCKSQIWPIFEGAWDKKNEGRKTTGPVPVPRPGDWGSLQLREDLDCRNKRQPDFMGHRGTHCESTQITRTQYLECIMIKQVRAPRNWLSRWQSSRKRPSTSTWRKWIRPTQSVMYVPLQVNRSEENILLIVQYRYLKSCSGDFCSPESDPPHKIMRYCGWVFHFHLTESVRRKWILLEVYQFRKGISAGPALKYFTWFIGAGGKRRNAWSSRMTVGLCAYPFNIHVHARKSTLLTWILGPESNRVHFRSKLQNSEPCWLESSAQKIEKFVHFRILHGTQFHSALRRTDFCCNTVYSEAWIESYNLQVYVSIPHVIVIQRRS